MEARSEMTETRIQRRLAAILAADVAGYSRLMGQDEAGTLAALREIWSKRFNPAVATHRGRVVKMMGDGALVEFGSAVDAVDCALAIQRAMADHNSDRNGAEPIEFRIGINLGDIVIEGEDIFGDGVNVAARLEAQAPRCGILISDAIHAQVAGKVSLTFTDAGELVLKNIALPVRAWRWGGDGSAAAAAPAAKAEDLPSIAVLPFDNMSNDPEQEYFSDGISEDIITDLSKIAGLMVVSRNSSFAYRGRTKDIRVVGRELGVTSVLEGSIRRAGNRVRISAQLIDARTGGHIWADRFDRELTDIFAVQDEVTLQIVGALKVQLRPVERARIGAQRGPDLVAHDFVLKAREIANDLLRAEGDNRANVERVIGLLREAIAADPDYALPYAFLAMVYTLEFTNGWLGTPDALDQIVHFATIALEKDPAEPVAHNAFALAKLFSGDYALAKIHAERAVALNPSFASGYGTLGNLEVYLGHPAAAIPLLEKAIRLDPLEGQMYTHFLGIALLLDGKTERAAEAFRHRIALAPGTDRSRVFLTCALGHLGRPDEARAVWAELKQINPDYDLTDHLARLPFAREKDKAVVRAGIAAAGISG